VNKGYVADNEE